MEHRLEREFQSDVVLRDGSLVTVRAAQPGDRPLLLTFLGSLSEESLSLRFSSVGVNKVAVVDLLLPGSGGFALLAFREGRVIGHAAFYVTVYGKAEPSIVIGDAYQGKGLGTALLGQLAEAATVAGVSIFEAIVLPENTRMIDVLQHLGFRTSLKIEPGLIHVTFPTSLLPEAVETFERREAIAATAALESFFRPRGVAVIGASRNPDSIGGRLFQNVLEAGFNGPVYPVNSMTDMVQSVVAYHSVVDCPGPVDLAIMIVPASSVLTTAKECAKKGVRALVVISSGFSESGQQGARLQQQLVEICRKSGMRLVGPNCMGIANTDPRVSLNAQFSPQRLEEGGIGILSQSGALGIAVIDYANKLGLGLSTFVSVGNKADISGNDIVQYWENDERTDVLLLYLESFGNPRKFARIAKRVARKKPIIAVKSGRSAAGFRATQSHTGALVAASDVTVDALFHQSGVIRTDTLSEMFDAAEFLSTQPVPKGDRVAIITNAGGAGILAADACEALGLKVPELSAQTQTALRSFLKQEASVRNPVDMIASARADDYARTILTIARDPSVEAMIIIFVPPLATGPEVVAEAILQSAKELQGRVPFLTTFMASHGISSLLTDGSIRVPSYPFPENAAGALAHAVRYGRWLSMPKGTLVSFSDTRKGEAAAVAARALRDKREWLSPEETELVLECYGISHVKTVRVKTPGEVGKATSQLGGKVAVKVVAPGLVHKTEVGGVRLNLSSAEEGEQAAREMIPGVTSAGFTATGFLVQPMVPKGREMLVGVVYDPLFGPAIACGAGGTLTELLKDFAIRLTPITDREADEMVRSLRTFPMLAGYRGDPIYDSKALEEVILRVGALIEDIPEIVELDLNPVVVLKEGEGAQVVDARMRVAESTPPLPLGAKKR